MLLFNVILLMIFLLDAIVLCAICKLFVKSKQSMPRRAQSKVRSKFQTIQEVKAFQDWRHYIKQSLIEVEIKNTLQGESKTKYLSI